MDDEVDISSGTDTDEDGALIEKARQAAEQKRAPPRKRGPTSEFWAPASSFLSYSQHPSFVLKTTVGTKVCLSFDSACYLEA